MKIEIKNLKHSGFASQETNCFEASVYIDGQKAGNAENDGRGGGTDIYPHTLRQRLDDYAKTLPEVVTSSKQGADQTPFTYKQTAETIIDDLVEEELVVKQLKQAMASRVLFTVKGEAGVFQTHKRTKAAVQRLLTTPVLLDAFMKQRRAELCLNLLPIDQAVAIFKSN